MTQPKSGWLLFFVQRSFYLKLLVVSLTFYNFVREK